MTPTTSLLDSILDPLAESLTDDAARRIVALRLEAQVQRRIDDLTAKASSGELTPQERADYAEAIDAIDLLGVFKAKTRGALAQRSK